MIDSLEVLAGRKQTLKKEIGKSEKKMSDMWYTLFHEDEDKKKANSPTQKILKIISNSSAVIDGVILGWKLYNRFGGRFRRRRK